MRLHIVMFSDLFLNAGGCESWLYKFLLYAEELLTFYSEIHVYGIISTDKQDLKRISSVIHKKNVFFHYSGLRRLKIYQKIFAFFKQQNTFFSTYCNDGDCLLSIGSFYEMFVSYLFRKKSNLKRLVWLRTILEYHLKTRKAKYFLPFICMLEGFCLHHMDYIIANGSDTKVFYEERYNLKDIAVIPNAIIAENISANITPFENEKIKIGFIGRLYPEKGFDKFVESVDIFNKSPSDEVEFIIIGDGEMKNEAIRLDKQYVNCSFLGSVSNDNIFAYLGSLDATVHLNFSNTGSGVSNSLLESLFANNLLICWSNKIFLQVVASDSAILVCESSATDLVNAYYFVTNNRDICKKKLAKASLLKKQYLFSKHIQLFLDIVRML